ncbi:MAG: TonB-dependent receptor plug domain-containing protein, partial [Paraglaciecola chathamensis]
MSNAFTTPFKLSAISIAVLMASNAIAQTQEGQNTQSKTETQVESKEASDMEIIEITGLKSSLKKSINDKRFSQNLVDTINAEDIGKSTDQNVADALSRVTGVSLVTRDGEGTQVTVRGATANQNNITINGQQLTSTDFSQAVDLSSFSADILSKLEVVKTSSADQDEGSLGANINLITLKPLDQKEGIRSFTAQGRYNDFAEEEDYKVQFTFTEKFLDDRLGIAFSAYDQTSSIRRDQYRVNRFEASTIIDSASDMDGNAISGVKGIRPNATRYELHQNTTERQGLTFGLQFLPDDVSELNLDITYSEQEYATRQDAVITRATGNKNFVEGVEPLGSQRPPAPFTDPQTDWYVIDTDTNTMLKELNRFGAGDLQASQGGNDQKNGSISLTYKRELTDTFRVSSQFGYSKSESKSLPSAFAAMQNFPQVPAIKLYDAGRDVEPVGYDCTTGTCEMVFGSSFADLGEQIVNETDPDTGIYIPGYEDNTVFTGYNPADINAQHLSFLSERDVTVSDELANGQLDFEYDFDRYGVTSFEFGAKVTKRTKDVDNQTYQFNSVTATEVVEDEFGNAVAIPGGALLDIRANLIAREGGLPYDDFMETLGYARNEATTGWTPVDPAYAVSLLLDDENTVRTPNDSESRITDIDTQAYYFKTNFDLFDGRLTGNIGMRYVKTDIAAEGYSGADFWQFTETLEREFDRVMLRDLRDTSLPECQAPVYSDPNQPLGYEEKYQRVDGQGWDTSSGPDPSGWTRIADQGPCHDPAFAQWAAFQQDPSLPDPGTSIGWLNMWRYADVSTTRNNGWDGNIVYDGTTPLATVNANQFSADSTTNRELQSFRATDTHTYTNWLPSL